MAWLFMGDSASRNRPPLPSRSIAGPGCSARSPRSSRLQPDCHSTLGIAHSAGVIGLAVAWPGSLLEIAARQTGPSPVSCGTWHGWLVPRLAAWSLLGPRSGSAGYDLDIVMCPSIRNCPLLTVHDACDSCALSGCSSLCRRDIHLLLAWANVALSETARRAAVSESPQLDIVVCQPLARR
jgi:hypothetical protein